jgi:phasin family protein
MHAGADDFLDEQTKGLAGLAEQFRKSQLAAARKAAVESAKRIRSLNGRVRKLAHSGVRLNSISHGAAQRLIELQAEIVNSALTDAAAQIERIAYTGSLRDLTREQADVLKSARERIAGDLSRVMTILRQAASDARQVTERELAPSPAKKKAAARKSKKPAVRKTKKPAALKAKKTAVRKTKRVVGKARRKAPKGSRR